MINKVSKSQILLLLLFFSTFSVLVISLQGSEKMENENNSITSQTIIENNDQSFSNRIPKAKMSNEFDTIPFGGYGYIEVASITSAYDVAWSFDTTSYSVRITVYAMTYNNFATWIDNGIYSTVANVTISDGTKTADSGTWSPSSSTSTTYVFLFLHLDSLKKSTAVTFSGYAVASLNTPQVGDPYIDTYSYSLKDNDSDGFNDQVIATLDPDFPAGSSGNVIIRASIVYEGVFATAKSAESTVFISGMDSTSFTLTIDPITWTDTYYVMFEVLKYQSGTWYIKDVKFSNIFKLYRLGYYNDPYMDNNWAFETYDSDADTYADSVRVINADPNLRAGVPDKGVSVVATLYDDTDTQISTNSWFGLISGSTVDSITVDLGAVTVTGLYYLKVQLYFNAYLETHFTSNFQLIEKGASATFPVLTTPTYSTLNDDGKVGVDSVNVNYRARTPVSGQTDTITIEGRYYDADGVFVKKVDRKDFSISFSTATQILNMGGVEASGSHTIKLSYVYKGIVLKEYTLGPISLTAISKLPYLVGYSTSFTDSDSNGTIDSLRVYYNPDFATGFSGSVTINGYLYDSNNALIKSMTRTVSISGHVDEFYSFNFQTVRVSDNHYVVIDLIYASTKVDTLTTSTFYLYAVLKPYFETFSLTTLDSDADGYTDYYVSNFDINYPEATNTQVNVTAKLSISGTQYDLNSSLFTVNGYNSDSFTLISGNIPLRTNYRLDVYLYFGSTLVESKVYTTLLLNPLGYGYNPSFNSFDVALNDTDYDALNDSIKVWFDPNYYSTTVTAESNISVILLNSSDSIVAVASGLFTFTGKNVDNFVLDLGTISTSDTYYITGQIEYDGQIYSQTTSNPFSLGSLGSGFNPFFNTITALTYDTDSDTYDEGVKVNYDPNYVANVQNTESTFSFVLFNASSDEIVTTISENKSFTGQDFDTFSVDFGSNLNNGTYYIVATITFNGDTYDVTNLGTFTLYPKFYGYNPFISSFAPQTYDTNSDGKPDSIRVNIDIDFNQGLSGNVDVNIVLWEVNPSFTASVDSRDFNILVSGSTASDSINVDFGTYDTNKFYQISMTFKFNGQQKGFESSEEYQLFSYVAPTTDTSDVSSGSSTSSESTSPADSSTEDTSSNQISTSPFMDLFSGVLVLIAFTTFSYKKKK